MAQLTYKDAGVNIQAGEDLVDRIKPLAAATHTPEVLTGLGGFAALCNLPQGIHDPVLVSGTDGVGTKLLVAMAAQRHDTVGIDLVAMCVNDVLTTGARPLFFLDYFSTTALDVEQATAVVSGIAKGCQEAGCALLGGETAEHPSVHGGLGYDLAGFCVGVAERAKLLPKPDVQQGDVVIGVASNGLHSNGYSLARKVLLEQAQLPLHATVDQLGEPLVDTLLRPTRIYAEATAALLAKADVKALCHVTGGGLPGNLHRVLPAGLGAKLHADSWRVPEVFELITRLGNVDRSEMYRVFNMGIGFTVVCAPDQAVHAQAALSEAGEQAMLIGHIVATPDLSGEARITIE